MIEKIINYLKKHSHHDPTYLRAHLLHLGFHSDEIDEAFEEFEEIRSIEEGLPLFPDPPKDINQN